MIVPEQYTLQLERKLLDESDIKGLLDIEVFGFQRFAYSFFEKYGHANKNIINDTTKLMLIKKILLESKNELKYYSKSINKQGFIDNVSQTFKEFYQSNFTLETLNLLLEKINDNNNINSATYSKILDLKLIYEKYINYISKEYLEADDILNILSKEIKNSSGLENYNFYLDSFIGFTISELNVIEELLKVGCDITVTLPIDIKTAKKEESYSYYYEPQKTYRQLVNIATRNDIYVENINLDNIKLDNEELQFLKENYFKGNLHYNKSCENIKIFSQVNIYEEVQNISKYIKHLIQNEDYRYKDFAIITGDIDEYEATIKEYLEKYEIPVFIDKKRNVLSHQIVEFIRSLIDIGVSNWGYESVFRFLKTGIIGIDEDKIHIVENYVLEWGIRGYKWHREWDYGFKAESNISFDEKYNKEELNEVREQIVNTIKLFSKDLDYNTKDTIINFSKKIFDVFYYIGIEDKIKMLVKYTEEKNITHLQDIHIKIWNKICDMFDEMVNILGDKEVTLIEYKNILEAGLTNVDIGVIPQTQDQVIFGNIKRTKVGNKKIIILIGCYDGNIPEISMEKGLLIDDDINTIIKMGYELRETTENINLSYNFLIYDLLLKATDKIIFSYSNFTLQGKALLKSPIIAKIEKMYDIIENNEEFKIDLKYFFNDIGDILRRIKNDEHISGNEKGLLYWFFNNEEYKDDVKKLIQTSEIVLQEEKLSKQTINKLYGNEIISSITKLEKYVACPFAYFMRYNLNAKERKLYQISNLDFGNLFHELLERFITYSETSKLDFDQINNKFIDSFVEKNIDEIVEGLSSEIFKDNERNKYFIVRIKRICKKSLWALTEHIKAGDFLPKKSELEFSMNKPFKGITLVLNDDKKLVITGKVDRIDICTNDGKQYVEIIDYKSSKKTIDLNDVYYGTQLQLVTYLDIIMKNSQELFGNITLTETGGIFYFNIHDPIIKDEALIEKILKKINKHSSREEIESMLSQKMLEEFKLTGFLNSDIEIIKKFDKNMDKVSKVVPIKLTKDGGIHSSYKKNTLSNKEFEIVRDYCYNKITSIGNEIIKGNIGVEPLKINDKTSCTYCEYSSVCQVNIIEEQSKFKELDKMTKDQTLLRMKDKEC